MDGSGAEVGEVSAVIGDEDMDIFDGLHVSAGGHERYVPADLVGSIEEGRVTIETPVPDLDEAPSAEEPGGVEVTRDRDAEL